MAFSPTSCPSCGAANRAQSAFCHTCGRPLTRGDPLGHASTRTTLAPAPGKTAQAALPSIEVSTNTQKTFYSLRPDKQEINIGRDPSMDIVIDAPVVSHFHAQIVRKGNQFILIHPHPSQPHTTNGLLYQGRHILGNEPFHKPLAHGDIFRIGDEHGAQVTLTYNDGSGVPQGIVPAIRLNPLGSLVSTSGSQSQPPQSQPQGKQQVQTHQHQPQPKNPHVMSTQVKVALIGALATIIGALITAKVIWFIPPIPHLHSSYTGSVSVTSMSAASGPRNGSITLSSIDESDQGQIRLTMVLSSADYNCQGSVNTSRHLGLTCTSVNDMNFHVVVDGDVSQDSGQLRGTLSATNSMNSYYYENADWSAQ